MTVAGTTAELLRLAAAAAGCTSRAELHTLHSTAECLMATAILQVVRDVTGKLPSELPDELRETCIEDVAVEIVGKTPAGLAYLDIASYARLRNAL